MEDLIKALQILNQYGNPKYPTHCKHDELVICGIDPVNITKLDRIELSKLGFFVYIEGVYDQENDFTPEESKIYSFRLGSA